MYEYPNIKKIYYFDTNKYIDKYNIDMIHNPIYYTSGKEEIVGVDMKRGVASHANHYTINPLIRSR